ncbi:GNAT family N-acetyltransferase [Shewanella sp. 1_MG-2023]|uniref:GNAT family N-acetyltransferase n=1 Tax=unclassified Shewanella TaxID=196818 RepID=UPI0026E14043|nr:MULTISPECIES: GNAT family N-acetyltransferase [unclassified Shewanella]MDO6612623.1 GNAT family N-acetyltransferase [Shewanella sp. 7_MG-2023]MDO6772322.1 GNAT family N-acetyltransferase [Shewanella sp. 2_MG-2023]MDO6795305.1 GNAT family N-acetyltransferase [Shewanella sp. 1_MG-2023]
MSALDSMQWKLVHFNQLSLDELYEVLKLRVDVFVVEQNCPYPELDNKDRLAETLHLLGINQQGELIAYTRILAAGVSYPQASIGRVIIAEQGRGKGIAHALMQRSIDVVKTQWPQTSIQIGAQQHLSDFYQQQGFTVNSEMYLEDGIPHIDMLLNL